MSTELLDSPEHLLECSKVLLEFQNLNYSDIFETNNKEQKELVVLFLQLLEIREKLIKEPATLDPCTSDRTSV